MRADYCFLVCFVMACISLGATWILAIATNSWMVNIRGTDRWLKPYEDYERVFWKEF